jgi:hypothetical protein
MMVSWFRRGSARGEEDREARATPAGTIAVGVLALGLALLASGTEVYMRWRARSAPADPAVAWKVQRVGRVKALADAGRGLVRECLPFNRQAEARMAFDDLVGKAALLSDEELKGLDSGLEALGQASRQPDREARARAALALVGECKRVADRH